MSSHRNKRNDSRFVDGDWNCGKCGFMNFACRTHCRSCNSSKYESIRTLYPNYISTQKIEHNYLRPLPKGVIKKSGDWICNACNDYQFARNDNCRNCGNPKSNVNESVDNNECVVCMELNKNTGFLHSDGVAHTCCCEGCAKEIMNTTKKCPMCNLEALQIFKNFQ